MWYAAPSRQDLESERQLIGIWGMWLTESDMDTSPQRVMEWLPGGKFDNYAPGFKHSSPRPDLEENWYVRNGVLILRTRTSKSQEIVKSKLNWLNPDTLRLTFEEGEWNPITIFYKRLDSTADALLSADDQGDRVGEGLLRTPPQ
jgi:hypothetical protein